MNNSMFRFYCRLAMAVTCFIAVACSESRKTSGNPVFPGWYIFYHRHPLGASDGNDREVCVDEMYSDDNGYILPVKMTFGGWNPMHWAQDFIFSENFVSLL